MNVVTCTLPHPFCLERLKSTLHWREWLVVGGCSLQKIKPDGELLGCKAEWSSEEKDVGFGLVGHVVDPTLTLLDPQIPPLRLGHQVGLGYLLGQFFGQDHVPVLELVVIVLVRVEDVLVGSHVSSQGTSDHHERPCGVRESL